MTSSAAVLTTLNSKNSDTKDAKTEVKVEAKQEHKLIKNAGGGFVFVKRDDFVSKAKMVPKFHSGREYTYWQPYKLHVHVNIKRVNDAKEAELDRILDPLTLDNTIQMHKTLSPGNLGYGLKTPDRLMECYEYIYLLNDFDEKNLSQIVEMLEAIEKWSEGIGLSNIYALSPCDLPLTKHVTFRLSGLNIDGEDYYVSTHKNSLYGDGIEPVDDETLIRLTKEGIQSKQYQYLAKALGLTIADDNVIKTIEERCDKISQQIKKQYEVDYRGDSALAHLKAYLMSHPDLLKLTDDQLKISLNITAREARSCSELFSKSACSMHFNPQWLYEPKPKDPYEQSCVIL